jgi:hypothetical protein
VQNALHAILNILSNWQEYRLYVIFILSMKRFICLWIIASFITSSVMLAPRSYAQGLLTLPAPGSMVNLSPAYVPVLIKGLKVHPENPLLFDFILDTGSSGLNVSSAEFKAESEKLIKYFLASLTIKEDDLWVNLSPYEKDRMIPRELGQTELGRDMLTQDYMLKQLTASLVYPEKKLGKEFWDRVYAKARQMYGTSEIPVNTFNKVWIVADKAKVLERNNTAYVLGAHLKVMLEEDYLSLEKHNASKSHAIASQVIRQIIIPELEREVNQGQNFAPLRQMFYSMILASWYRLALKDALLNQVYSNKAKTDGVLSDDPQIKEKIYRQYLKAYKKGVFNYIKEEVAIDPKSKKEGIFPRKYFSGGLAKDLGIPGVLDLAHAATFDEMHSMSSGDLAMVDVNMAKQMLRSTAPSAAMRAEKVQDIVEELFYIAPSADSVKPALEMDHFWSIWSMNSILKAPQLWSKQRMIGLPESNIGLYKQAVLYLPRWLKPSNKNSGLAATAAVIILSHPDIQEFNKLRALAQEVLGHWLKIFDRVQKDESPEGKKLKEEYLGKQISMTAFILHGAATVMEDAQWKAYAQQLLEMIFEEKLQEENPNPLIIVPMALDLQSIETGLHETTISKINEVLAPYLKYFDEDNWLDVATKAQDVHLKYLLFQVGMRVSAQKLLQKNFRQQMTQLLDMNLNILHPTGMMDMINVLSAVDDPEFFKKSIYPQGRQINGFSARGHFAADVIQNNAMVSMTARQLNFIENRRKDRKSEWIRNSRRHSDMLQNRYTGSRGSLIRFTDKTVKEVGGIDLNARHMNLDIAKDGKGVEIKFDPAVIAQFRQGNFSGIVPVIIRITPVVNLLPLLGISPVK